MATSESVREEGGKRAREDWRYRLWTRVEVMVMIIVNASLIVATNECRLSEEIHITNNGDDECGISGESHEQVRQHQS